MKKAVFVDRDGTLIEDVGYLSRIEDIRIIPGAVEAVRMLNENDFKVIMVTNQAAIARGIITEESFKSANAAVMDKFDKKHGFLDYYYCPHHPVAGESGYTKTCDCRKPAPGMIFKAGKEHGIDVERSFMVGDKSLDIECGKNAGCRTVLVLTGYGKETEKNIESKPDHVAENILKAAEWIVERG